MGGGGGRTRESEARLEGEIRSVNTNKCQVHNRAMILKAESTWGDFFFFLKLGNFSDKESLNATGNFVANHLAKINSYEHLFS